MTTDTRNLSVGETLVYRDGILEVIWNGSATFRVYIGGQECDVFTVYGCSEIWQAVTAAVEWVNPTWAAELERMQLEIQSEGGE